VCHRIHRHAENVALDAWPDGSILMHEGRVIPIEGVAAQALDTTGAGDMYAGALLYGITNGLSWNRRTSGVSRGGQNRRTTGSTSGAQVYAG